MRTVLVLLALSLAYAGTARASVDYVLSGTPYSSITDFTAPCSVGTCANFPPGSRLSGRFTVPARLPPNAVNLNVFPQVTSFSFSDGLNVYSSSDPEVRVLYIAFDTDANGAISGGGIGFNRWLSGTSPHTPGDRVSNMGFNVTSGMASYNTVCVNVATAISTGVADSCLSIGASDAESSASGPGSWSILVSSAAVPTLTEAALALLALLVATVGMRHVALARRGSAARRR